MFARASPPGVACKLFEALDRFGCGLQVQSAEIGSVSAILLNEKKDSTRAPTGYGCAIFSGKGGGATIGSVFERAGLAFFCFFGCHLFSHDRR